MWAPLLEKGYARYTQVFGQYGGFDAANANAGASGYDVINGGIANYSWPILYGSNSATATWNTPNWMAFSAGSNNIATNMPALANLLRISGKGVSAGNSFAMTSAISPATSINRLGTQVSYILGLASSSNYPVLKKHLQRLSTSISAWSAGPTAVTQADVVKRAVSLIKPGNWPLLHASGAPAEYRELNELTNIVANLGTDSSKGQRFVYAWHSYAILGAQFRDRTGKDLALTQATLPTQLGNIDPDKSRVDLMNPHGTNEPDEHGRRKGGPEDKLDDGRFSLSLGQYLRSFEFQQFGTVKATP